MITAVLSWLWDCVMFLTIYGTLIFITFVMVCGICGLGHTPPTRKRKNE